MSVAVGIARSVALGHDVRAQRVVEVRRGPFDDATCVVARLCGRTAG